MTTSNRTTRARRAPSLARMAFYGLLTCAMSLAATSLPAIAQGTQTPADPHAAHRQQAKPAPKKQSPKTGQKGAAKPAATPAPDPHAGHHGQMKAAQEAATNAPGGENVRMSIPDLELLDQDGRKIRFYTDLVKDRVVVINFIFTTCTTICPPLGATFARVQKDLGERTGRDVHFISVSVDPVTDTPERLKAWGAKFKAGAGWTFVTGDKQRMDELLRALASSVARREDHSPTVIIGNDAKGTWTRTYGLAKPSQLVAIIDGMLGANTAAASSVK